MMTAAIAITIIVTIMVIFFAQQLKTQIILFPTMFPQQIITQLMAIEIIDLDNNYHQ